MKYISDLQDGDNIRGIYLCKQKRTAETRNGKAYDNLLLQDKTGTLDGKIWDPNSSGIADYAEKDFIEIVGDVITYNNNLQLNVKQLRVAREGEYTLADYLPSTDKNVEEMYQELLAFIAAIEQEPLRKVCAYYYKENEDFIREFKGHSAAKSVHHSFAGGLLEHTVAILRLCRFFADHYPIINRSLLYAGALYHDIGKIKELSPFPENDYTDEGQLVGHIVIVVEMLNEALKSQPDFPVVVANELKHCILAHHGELEFGSPKKPALIEAVVLNLADNADSKLQILIELFGEKTGTDWLGYNRLFESNLRRTSQ